MDQLKAHELGEAQIGDLFWSVTDKPVKVLVMADTAGKVGVFLEGSDRWTAIALNQNQSRVGFAIRGSTVAVDVSSFQRGAAPLGVIAIGYGGAAMMVKGGFGGSGREMWAAVASAGAEK